MIITSYVFKVIDLIQRASWSWISASIAAQSFSPQICLNWLFPAFCSPNIFVGAVTAFRLESQSLCVQWQGCIILVFHLLVWLLQLWGQTLPRGSLCLRINIFFSITHELDLGVWAHGTVRIKANARHKKLSFSFLFFLYFFFFLTAGIGLTGWSCGWLRSDCTFTSFL